MLYTEHENKIVTLADTVLNEDVKLDINNITIHKGCKIGKHVTIYNDTVITGNSVISDNAMIHSKCTIDNSMISNCLIMDYCNIIDSVIDDRCAISQNVHIDTSTINCKSIGSRSRLFKVEANNKIGSNCHLKNVTTSVNCPDNLILEVQTDVVLTKVLSAMIDNNRIFACRLEHSDTTYRKYFKINAAVLNFNKINLKSKDAMIIINIFNVLLS